jgi:hypothetical protein
MNIQNKMIKNAFDGSRCYVHARGAIRPDGFGVITTQKLELSGCDVFYGLEMMKTTDGGKTFSAPVPCENLKRRYLEDGTCYVMCDATPFYHKTTGKIILTGHMAWYGENNKALGEARHRSTLYAVYNEQTKTFDSFKMIEMPDTDTYFSSGAGCTQIAECENGDLLIPIYYNSRDTASNPNACSTVTVMRCSFDGENIKVLEIGNPLTTDIPRGLGEPSVIRFGDEYMLCLRNDVTGFVTKGHDGIHFDTPRELCFDNGENLGNYNTQQHWLVGGDKLWLIYTRKAGFNDHIFRHRAPLFIAEFDPIRMCVIRSTEQIAVPERGARLGNFGCQSYSEQVGYIFAAEWMQNGRLGWEECAKHGSDNSIFVSTVTY